MKRKAISLMLICALILANVGAVSFAETSETDVLRGIFRGIDDVDPNLAESKLPYLDGTVLSDIREPLYLSSKGRRIFGESNFDSKSLSWNTSSDGVSLKGGAVSISGSEYSLSGEFKQLAACEGDLNGDGRKNELAVIAAARKTDGGSLMLLCTASAQTSGTMTPVIVLYDSKSGTGDFYADTADFVNCIALVCADLNGDGFDEIVTAAPTSGYGKKSSDKYGFDKTGGSSIWYLNGEPTADSWKSSAGWSSSPKKAWDGMNISMATNECYIGSPGVSVSLAAGDIDGDGYDDLISAVSTTNAQYNNSYFGNMYAVYYIGGMENLDELYLKRRSLLYYLDGTVTKRLYLNSYSGDASGFDVAVSDIDGSGKPTILMSMKETSHRYPQFSNKGKMFTPSFYIYSFDYVKSSGAFVSSMVYQGGIYNHGWKDSFNIYSDYTDKTLPSDCAPIRIGTLKGDFGLSDGKDGYVSSGTIVADQKYISFVRYPDGNKYRYDIKDNGSYTGTWGDASETGFKSDAGVSFKTSECVFYKNGINVTDIRTANISFDGNTYEDAALVRAYTNAGLRTYYLSKSGSGYRADKPILEDNAAYSVISMPDTDNDSIRLEYKKHKFFWADPIIIAALASPPYFASLPSDMYTNSQTTYGKSISTSGGTTESFKVSAGAYISTEIKAGGGGTSAVFESESQALKSSGIDKEQMTEVTYSQSFSTSGGEDTVVLTTVAYDAYAYTAYYQGINGEYASSPYIVYVPRNGADSIKTASLNYDDYREFAKYANGALPDMSDVFTHTVGKPGTYPRTAPSGANVLNGSIIEHPNLASFPSNTGSQTLTTEITNETTETTSSGSSVSVKLGGGVESEADDIFGMVDMGTKVTGGYVSEKEYESGRIKATAVGTSFEGTVFGQGDGIRASGTGMKKADFNWRLLHYIYNFKDENRVRQFPVITYIIPEPTEPEGVCPTSLSVTPGQRTVEQVGPKTDGYANEVNFTAHIEGVSREAYTALEGAPLGMTLNTGGGNIGRSGDYNFGVKINGNVLPGEYELTLNVGGVLSNPFKVTVTEYEEPVWIEAEEKKLDFGSMRYNYAKGTPSADTQYVTIKNIHTEQIKNLGASLSAESPFEITQTLSRDILYPSGLENSTATIGIAPKKGLDIGTHTDTLTVTNGVTAAFVTLIYTVTEPTLPNPPEFKYTDRITSDPVMLLIHAPEDDGGAKMTDYKYTIKDHEEYTENGEQIWKSSYLTCQSGSSSYIYPRGSFKAGEKYTIGVKAVNTCGESSPAWFEFEVAEPANDPEPVSNVKIYPGDGKFTLTWDPITYWGENKYVTEVAYKTYQVFFHTGDDKGTISGNSVEEGDDLEYTKDGLQNGKEYTVEICTTAYSNGTYHQTGTKFTVTPSAEYRTAPSRPKGFKAEISYKKAELSWSGPSADGGSEITGYKLSKDGGNSWISVGNATAYTFDNLTTNEEYDFRVLAVNSIGDGDYASVIKTAPPKLGAPAISNVIHGYEQLELEWEPSTDEGVIGWQLKLDDGEWNDIEPIMFDGKLHYIIKGLENEVDYMIYLRAVDGEGGGNAGRVRRSPKASAPRPPINPRVEPKNGGIQFFAERYSESDSLKYKVDGGKYWWSFSSGLRMNGYENGKTYTVAIATEGDYYGTDRLRSTTYLTVTPDASIPDPPSAPEVDAFVGDDYIRINWKPTGDGGSEILSYAVYIDDEEEPIILPASETSFVIKTTEEDRGKYRYIYVSAINDIGESEFGSASVSPNVYLRGENRLVLQSSYTSAFSLPFKLERVYSYFDENDNEVNETVDCTKNAEWSISADNEKLTWDNENKRIKIADGLADGEYDVTVNAAYNYANYEKQLKIIVGAATVKIVSAEKVSDGAAVKLELPETYGNVMLCAAAYDSADRLLNISISEISSASLSGGMFKSPINTDSAAYVKIMLLADKYDIRPLCESYRLKIK